MIPKRMKKTQRILQLIELSTELLGEHGYRGVTTAMIAQEAGIKEMILYRCFANKDDLVLQCIQKTSEDQIARWQQIRRESKTAMECLKTIIKNYILAPSAKSPGFQMLHRIGSEKLPSFLQSEIAKLYNSYIDYVAKLLEESGFKKNSIRAIAWSLLHWGHGLGSLQLLPFQENLDVRFLENQIQLVSFFLDNLKEQTS